MLQRHPGLASTTSRPLDLTIRHVGTSSGLCLTQQPLPPCLQTRFAVIQSPSSALRHNTSLEAIGDFKPSRGIVLPPDEHNGLNSSELERSFRSYSFAPARVQDCHGSAEVRLLYKNRKHNYIHLYNSLFPVRLHIRMAHKKSTERTREVITYF